MGAAQPILFFLELPSHAKYFWVYAIRRPHGYIIRE